MRILDQNNESPMQISAKSPDCDPYCRFDFLLTNLHLNKLESILYETYNFSRTTMSKLTPSGMW